MQDGKGAMLLALVLFGKRVQPTCPRVRHPADCSMSGVWGDPMCLPAGSCSGAAAPLWCYRPLDFFFCLYAQYSCRKALTSKNIGSLNKHMNVVNFVVGDTGIVYVSSCCPASFFQFWNCNVMSVCTMDS